MLTKETLKILNAETAIVPYKSGLKLLKPSKPFPKIQLNDLLALRMSVYFLDAESTTYCMNEYGANLCGFDSARDSVGRTLKDVADLESANQLMQNSRSICRMNRVQVFEERLLNNKGAEQAIFSIKFPWFNQDNQLLGSAGFSFNLQTESMLSSLRQLRELGLFNQLTMLVSDNFYEVLTPRENDCAYWLIRGYSAKQIAQKLDLSFRTVEEYLLNMKYKMKVNSKQALIEKLIDG
ncbi:two component system sensor kinase SsrB [Legionella massiliensis]|uniref:Two component system sensor kinase SsrB n=1 Tax=Legionella massiliensis TaxID=1034943 RepID=A0A078KVW7_9GAMM|nr:helix-turn-helix transcriptional regulator [Legionella massiliensis]CDZ78575.1 two component system sensor kinase SsrB [Legionella massiliensis]CEE14313.1 transcriptional regulator NarP [Legionella massiliensis]